MNEEQFDVILEDDEGVIRPRKTKPIPKGKQKENSWEWAGMAGQVGFDVALPMVVGLMIGLKLDDLWGTRPNVTLILFGVGIIIGCTSLIRIVRDASKRG